MAYPRLGDDDAFTFSKGSEVVLLHYHPVISFAGSSPPGREGPGQQSQTRQRVRLPQNKDRAPSALGGRPPLTPGRLLHRQPARSRPILPVLDIFPSPYVSSHGNPSHPVSACQKPVLQHATPVPAASLDLA